MPSPGPALASARHAERAFAVTLAAYLLTANEIAARRATSAPYGRVRSAGALLKMASIPSTASSVASGTNVHEYQRNTRGFVTA